MRGLLVFGATGQVARALAPLAPGARFLARGDADLMDPGACGGAILAERPHAVLNLAAWTAVDRAESQPGPARIVNADAPAAMAEAAARLGIPFLHVSTDYVFDGSGDHARPEDAPTAPLGVYGATKLAGEAAIARAGGHWAVMRTSWVFSGHGANFMRSMLRLGAERSRIAVVADQIGGPTPADDIAAALLRMARIMRDRPDSTGGLYHYAGAPNTSWAGFARAIMERARLDCRVTDIPTADYPTPARRPLNSRLDCGRIARDFGIGRPDWRAGLDRALAEDPT